MTLLRRIYKLSCLLAVLTWAAPPARADLRGVMVISADPAQLKAALRRMSATQRDSTLADPVFQSGGSRYRFFVSGDKSRIDTAVNGIGSVSFLTTGEPPKRVMLIPALGRYEALPPEQGRAPQGAASGVRVVPTAETKTLLGHVVHKYRLTFRAKGVTSTCEVWAAPDLPALPAAVFSALSQSPVMQHAPAKIQGMILETTYTVSLPGKVTVTERVSSLSVSSVPPVVFAIPPGYSPAAQ